MQREEPAHVLPCADLGAGGVEALRGPDERGGPTLAVDPWVPIPEKRTPKRLRREESIANLVGQRMRWKTLREADYLLSIFPVLDMYGTPDRRKIEPRVWHPRNYGELLLGVGWTTIEPATLWSCIESGVDRKIPLADLFAVEFPLAVPLGRGAWRLDLARAYPGRIEMPTCDLAHRIAILDMASENRRDGYYELLVEKHCGCFFDGKLTHEGSAFFYRWR